MRIPWRPGCRNGRRSGLKSHGPRGRVGSNPTPGTHVAPYRALADAWRLIIRDHLVITNDQTVPQRRAQVGFAAFIGAVAGAALGASWGRRAIAAGAIAGAMGLGASEAIARARQQSGEIPA